MKKIIIIFVLFVSYTSLASAQNIEKVLATIPESVFYGLDADQKELLLSDSKDTAAVVVQNNDLYEAIKRVDYTENFLSLKTSDVGTVQIKLLPLINDSKIICVVKTVCRNICDSEIRFYTTNWMPITQSELFPIPEVDWFLKKDIDRTSDKFKNAIAPLDMLPIKITLSPTNDTLLAEYDITKYLSKEDYKQILPYLIEQPKTLTWDKTGFR